MCTVDSPYSEESKNIDDAVVQWYVHTYSLFVDTSSGRPNIAKYSTCDSSVVAAAVNIGAPGKSLSLDVAVVNDVENSEGARTALMDLKLFIIAEISPLPQP